MLLIFYTIIEIAGKRNSYHLTEGRIFETLFYSYAKLLYDFSYAVKNSLEKKSIDFSPEYLGYVESG